MAEAPAIDASPIIYLSRTGDLDLLTVRGKRILVPVPVAEEIRAKGPDDPAVEALGASPFLHVVEPPPAPAKLRSWELGRGETAVLAWASSHHVELDEVEAARFEALLAEETNQEVAAMEMTWAEKLEHKGLEQGLERGRREGIDEGRREGMRALLLDLLEKRFGPLLEETRRQISTVDSIQELSRLAERVLEARSLEEMGLR